MKCALTSSRSLRALLVALLAATPVPRLRAQWSSIPYNASKPLLSARWFEAHDPGSGLMAFSAIAQTWTPIAAAGVAASFYCDSAIVTDDGAGALHAWSAYSNTSSAQPIAAGYSFKTSSNAGTSYAIVYDPASGGFGALRAYSAYTSSWSSIALDASLSGSLAVGANVAAQKIGAKYHAYSAYTGQWVSVDAPNTTAFPIVGADFVAIDLANGASGPFQYAAFSAPRGIWALSPIYPASGSGPISNATASAFAIKADIGSATSLSYAGYSAFTGQWSLSSLVHPLGTSKSTSAIKNVVRIQDADPSARYEIFGAGNGIWQSLSGPNLLEESVHEDFHVVRSSSGSPATVWAASALVGGGYTSISVPTSAPTVSPGTHGCVVYGGASVSSTSAWAYSAATNAFQAPIPFPQQGGPLLVPGGTSFGFNLKGASSNGTHAQAFSVRWNQWVAGPVVDTAHSWATDGNGAALALLRVESAPAGFSYTVFDEHSNTWIAAPAVSTSYRFGPNSLLAYSPATGEYWGYSAQRGDWTLETGIGALQCNGGAPSSGENLVWLCDSNNKLWVFALPDRTQSWFHWPAGKNFCTSGATPGGSTPYVGLSVRGTPASEFALVYASTALAPLAIPGFSGLLDLSIAGAFQLANLGLIDADGVREARVPIPAALPAGMQAWLQAVTLDLGSGQAGFAGRATGARFF